MRLQGGTDKTKAIKWRKGSGFTNPYSKLKTIYGYGSEEALHQAYWTAFETKKGGNGAESILTALKKSVGYTEEVEAVHGWVEMSTDCNW